MTERERKMEWTEGRKDELSRLYGTMTGPELAERLGTTARSVYVAANRLGLHKRQPRRIELTEDRELWLKLNFPHMSNRICALILGISERSVNRLAKRLGLRKTERFMEECRAHTARKAKESHLRNGTYPPKGVYNANLQKGGPYRFRPGHAPLRGQRE